MKTGQRSTLSRIRGAAVAGSARIVLCYVAFAATWILASDQIVNAVFRDPVSIMIASVGKGWVFVIVTGVMLYVLIRRFSVGLASREAQLNTLLETIPDLVWVKDPSGVFLTCNRAFADVHDTTPAKTVGRTDFDLFDRDLAERIRDEDNEVIRTHGPLVTERWTTPYGKTNALLLEIIKTPMYDAEGVLIGVLGIGRDITLRKELEESLREGQDKLASILENVGASIYIKDVHYRYQFANRAVCDYLGKSPEEIVGSVDADFFDEATATFMRENDRRVLEDGERIVVEETNTSFPGDEGRAFLTVKLPLRRQDGTIYALCGISTDIGERKKIQDALLASEAMLRRSQRMASLGHYVLDIAAREYVASDVLASVFGIGPEYPRTSEAFFRLVHPEDREEMSCYFLNDVLTEGNPFDREYRIVRVSDGAVRWMHGLGELEYDAAGNLARMVGTIQDITERKEHESRHAAEMVRRRHLFDRSRDGIAIVNEGGYIVEMNPSYAEIIGYHVDELVGLAIWDIDSMMGEGEVLQVLAHVPIEGVTIESQLRHKNGAVVDVEVSVNRAAIADEPLFFAVCRDITERKATERALRESEEEFRMVVESSPNGIAIVDDHGCIATVNREIELAFGYPREELIGKRAEMLFPATLRTKYRKECRRTPKRHSVGADNETIGLHRDGHEFPIELGLASMQTTKGSYTLLTVQDISARKQAEEQIRTLALYDGLTGLPNRNLFLQSLKGALTEAQRANGRVALMLLDLDHFKNINDSLGHHVGDQVLVEVTRRLTEILEPSDQLARLGGDEFVLLVQLPADGSRNITSFASRILTSLAGPMDVGEAGYHLAASIGISCFPDDAIDSEGLQRYAELAMYHAKEQGRNTFEFYSQVLGDRSNKRLAMETALRSALDNGEFVLYYQPIVNLATGATQAVEALIRWQHPEFGMVPPDQFIPIVEESNLIFSIGAWVLRSACDAATHWQKKVGRPITLSVNLSTRQFEDPGLAVLVSDVLKETGLPPECLQLEITESMVMNDPEQAINHLLKLKQLGVVIAIDDFGTGYSSLAYLRRFPIDCIKVDRYFVRDVATDTNSAAIAEAIVALAHSMHLRVVAEGVETLEQLRFLSNRGCPYVQGYFFSKPVPEHDFEVLLGTTWSPAIWRGEAFGKAA